MLTDREGGRGKRGGVGGGGGRGEGGDEGRREFPALYFKFDPMPVPSWSCCFSNHVGSIFFPLHYILLRNILYVFRLEISFATVCAVPPSHNPLSISLSYIWIV